jgi:hypothetical protein
MYSFKWACRAFEIYQSAKSVDDVALLLFEPTRLKCGALNIASCMKSVDLENHAERRKCLSRCYSHNFEHDA